MPPTSETTHKRVEVIQSTLTEFCVWHLSESVSVTECPLSIHLTFTIIRSTLPAALCTFYTVHSHFPPASHDPDTHRNTRATLQTLSLSSPPSTHTHPSTYPRLFAGVHYALTTQDALAAHPTKHAYAHGTSASTSTPISWPPVVLRYAQIAGATRCVGTRSRGDHRPQIHRCAGSPRCDSTRSGHPPLPAASDRNAQLTW